MLVKEQKISKLFVILFSCFVFCNPLASYGIAGSAAIGWVADKVGGFILEKVGDKIIIWINDDEKDKNTKSEKRIKIEIKSDEDNIILNLSIPKDKLAKLINKINDSNNIINNNSKENIPTLSKGGERPTVSSPWIIGSFEDLIIKQAKKIINISSQVKNIEANKKFDGDSLKLDKSKELEEESDKLKNILSSSNKNIEKKYKDFKKFVIKDKNSIEENIKISNNEIVELLYARENTVSLINVVQKELNNKRDYNSVIELYEILKTCFVNLIKMNDDFLSNADKKYKNIIDSNISRKSKEKEEITKIMESSNNVNTLNKEMSKKANENLKNTLKSLNKASDTLKDQKKWVKKNITTLKNKLSTIEDRLKIIKVSKDKTDFEKSSNLDFLKLEDYDLPLLINLKNSN